MFKEAVCQALREFTSPFWKNNSPEVILPRQKVSRKDRAYLDNSVHVQTSFQDQGPHLNNQLNSPARLLFFTVMSCDDVLDRECLTIVWKQRMDTSLLGLPVPGYFSAGTAMHWVGGSEAGVRPLNQRA